jgi:hypothetical protein
MLSGAQARRLSEALRDAFSPDDLAQVLYFTLDKRLEDITLDGGYEARAFDVIRAAEREGWTARLVDAACDARPGNVALAGLRDELRAWTDADGPPAGERQSGAGLGERLLRVRLRGASGRLVIGFGPGDTVIVVDHDAVVHRWRIADGAELAALPRGERLRDGIHVAIATSEPAIAFARPGKLTVAHLDGATSRVAAEVPLGRDEFIARGGGERFATYNGKRIVVRDFRDGAVLWEQPCPPGLATTTTDPAGAVVATADGRVGANGNQVSAGTQDKTRLHGLTLANVPLVGAGCVLGLSPGGELLAAASLREVVLVRPWTGEVVFRRPARGFRQEVAPVLGTRPQRLIPAPEGAVLWLRGGSVVVIRRDDDLHHLSQDGDIDDIAFDYARSRLAMVNSDGLVTVWRWR